MLLDKELFGILSLVFVLLARVPYVLSILRNKTRPHVFTWILWSLLTTIAASAQYVGNAGPGAWATALTAATCVLIVALSFRHGERNITRGDWLFFSAGLAALPLWWLTDSPLTAVVLVTLTDATAYGPTFRKAYAKPYEEMAWNFVVSNLKHVASFFAMTAYTATTLFNPGVVFVMNSLLILMLLWRRRMVNR